MPKISETRKEERRQQILDGAQRAFARHGFEGATVKRLEDEIGLSRGAIFNYFESKDDLFLQLCRRDGERMSELFVEGGVAAVLKGMLEVDPAWYGVYIELTRRVRTDESFRKRIEERQGEISAANRARLAEAQRSGEFRDDLAPRELGQFINLVLNGLALARASGDELPAPKLVLRLLEDAIGGRPRKPKATKRARAPRSASP